LRQRAKLRFVLRSSSTNSYPVPDVVS